jgi:hypothetical protein
MRKTRGTNTGSVLAIKRLTTKGLRHLDEKNNMAVLPLINEFGCFFGQFPGLPKK